MARRRALLATGALALGLVALAPSAPAPASAVTAAAHTQDLVASRPNILLITSDDQRADDMRWMPYTRRLITRQGVDATGFISPHPLCCPARAEILTGEYAQNNGVRHNVGPYGGWSAFVANGNAEDHLGVWLQDAGYRTGFVGKMLNGYTGQDTPPPGFDHWNPTIAQVYGYYGTTFYADGDPVRYPDEHVADVAADYTRDYLADFARGRRPWFLWVSHVGPHSSISNGGQHRPPIPAERHAGLFAGEPLPSASAGSFNEEDLADKPPAVSGREPMSPRRLTKAFRARIRTLQSIDEANRSAVRQLRRLGELDNTYIVFTSDNGYLLGEHRLQGKNYPYEEALRVPFSIRGPGLPAGTAVDDTLTTVDLAPTFLAWAGVLDRVRARGRTDGIDMTPVLEGTAAAPATQLIQAGTDDPVALGWGWWWRGVRTARWTYAHWYDGADELYDRRNDPWQLDNLAQDPDYLTVRVELARRLDALASCAGADACHQDFGPEPRPRRAG